MVTYSIEPELYYFKETCPNPTGEKLCLLPHMINRLPIQILDNKSPIEVLDNFYPHFRTSNGLIPRIFGCTTFVHVHKEHRGKLDLRAIKCIFLGYSPTQKGYKCYNPSPKNWYIYTYTPNINSSIELELILSANVLAKSEVFSK
ncbi:hypothetical protein CR513_05230, partial [Mucuna pruriens]